MIFGRKQRKVNVNKIEMRGVRMTKEDAARLGKRPEARGMKLESRRLLCPHCGKPFTAGEP